MSVLPGTIAAKRRRAAIEAGTWRPFVDPAPAIEHVAYLRRCGVAPERIAEAAHVGPATIARLAYPTSTRHPVTWGIRPATERAVLAVTPLSVPDESLIYATGTARRIQALATRGWRMTDVADRLGVSVQAVSKWLRSARITARNARAVASIYAEWADRAGPSELVARRAAAHGWTPPAAWDDIDDPAAIADVGDQSPDVIDLDEWAWLVRSGEHPDVAARRCGSTAKDPSGTIEVAARRAGRDDILALLAQVKAAAA